MTPIIELRDHTTSEALARAAGAAFVDIVPESREFFVALSGGRIAKLFYEAIVARTGEARKSLHGVHFFFADERCVPPTDAESNFLVARQALFDPLQIRSDRIHRIHGEVDPTYGASEAEAEICRLAPLTATGQPILDLVILGVGEDGHTASLFPSETDEARKNPAVYRPVVASKPPPRRITIGYGALSAAHAVWVLAAGAGKGKLVAEILQPRTRELDHLPLKQVIRSRSKTLIFRDSTGYLHNPT